VLPIIVEVIMAKRVVRMYLTIPSLGIKASLNVTRQEKMITKTKERRPMRRLDETSDDPDKRFFRKLIIFTIYLNKL